MSESIGVEVKREAYSSVRVSKDVLLWLKSLGRKGETYNDILLRVKAALPKRFR